MVRVRLLPMELPTASSVNVNDIRSRSSFLKRLALVFILLAALGLVLYVPVYQSVQETSLGIGETPLPGPPGPPGGSRYMSSVVQLPGWSINTTRDLRVYIEPDNSTTVLSPTELCTSAPYLLIIVCSAVANQKARDAIRNTWANWNHLDSAYNSSVRVAFLLGESKNDTLNVIVSEENFLYNDIIQERFHDTYNNLTLKSVMMLKWVTGNCANAKYLMKTDDDMFINVPALLRVLRARVSVNDILLGALICNARPISDPKNKWYTPKYMYSEKIYPNYLSGTGYVMSMDVASKLYKTALSTPLLHLEDVYLTGVCAKRAKLRPVHNSGFGYAQRKLDPCVYRSVVTAHRVTSANLYAMWNKLNDTSLVCAGKSPKVTPAFLSRKGRSAGYFVKRRNAYRCV